MILTSEDIGRRTVEDEDQKTDPLPYNWTANYDGESKSLFCSTVLIRTEDFSIGFCCPITSAQCGVPLCNVPNVL